MNILILHNNNIPIELLLKTFNYDGNNYYTEQIKYSSESNDSFDAFLCTRLSEIFQRSYNIIVIPYTLGEENYSGFSGLRVAAHIRLTKEWNHFTAPILFLGNDNIEDVMRLSDLGGLLTTYRIYTSAARTIEELNNKISHIDGTVNDESYTNWLADSKFQHFLSHVNVKAPANYASHHSVANKWAVLRWIEMFSWDGEEPLFDDEKFKNMLYFKYLLAYAGNREMFTSKKKKNNPIKPIINDVYKNNDYDLNGRIIKRKRVVYIDDEEKIWRTVLKPIFAKSNIDYVPYVFDQNKKMSKEELIKDIKSFLKQDYKNNGGADCYLIDLRLHDGDFADKIKSEDLSGQLIAKYIKDELNKGCQIVIFTASNKAWNIEESMIKTGACGYVIKESPEMNYSRDESYQLFCDFSNKIREAFNLSYLQQLYKTLDDFKEILKEKDIITPLYEYADLLSFDNGRNSVIILKSCIISQMRFLENLILRDFQIEASGTILRNGVKIGNCCTPKRIIFNTNIDDVDFIDKNKPSVWNDALLDKDISKIVAVLLLFYKIDILNVRKTVKLKHERNTTSAHGNKATTVTIDDLKEHFEKVIVPILKKEIENQ